MASRTNSSSNSNAPHLGPVVDEGRADGDRYGAHELAMVLSHYDLGPIDRIRRYVRGSRRAPKLRLTAARGEFMLKRRAPGKDEARRVSFSHELQLYLERRKYPVAGLIKTRTDGQSVLVLHGRTYEMFRFVEGERDDKSLGSAGQSGRALGHFHRLLRGYEVSYRGAMGSYHASGTIESAIKQAPTMITAAGPADPEAELAQRCQYLYEAYHDAAERAGAAGIAEQARGVIHGDWHPGNLLYRDGAVVAVLDFDSARYEARIIDLANAALQFSMKMDDPKDLDNWSSKLDVERIRALVWGYNETVGEPLTTEERSAVPWLMVEAIILESILPIAATGRFGELSGSAFLRMIERKVRWLRPRAEKLAEYLEQ